MYRVSTNDAAVQSNVQASHNKLTSRPEINMQQATQVGKIGS